MKKHLGLVILLVVVGIALWWFIKPLVEQTPAPAKIVAAPSAPKPIAQIPSATPIPAALPVAQPVPTQSELQTDADPLTEAPDVDPNAKARAELKAVISDQISLLEAGDKAGYMLKYTPPKLRNVISSDFAKYGITFEQYFERQRGRPLAAYMQEWLVKLKYIRDQDVKPKLNQAGDKAEYPIDPALTAALDAVDGKRGRPVGAGPRLALNLQKINGRWYNGTNDN